MDPRIAEQLQRLPEYLGAHLTLTLIAMMAGIAISLPLAMLVIRLRVLQGPVLGAASVIQTIPSLAMLALMVPLLGQIGLLPAILALTLFSLLPILRNTVTGVLGIDAAIIEAARGVGMTENQILWRVQLPLASPVIIAGVRTATVWVVGIATLSTPVGATSLGNYIFSGLQTQNEVAVLVGCVAAATLAIVLDQLIRALELAAVRRSRPLALTAAAGVALVLAAGLLPPAWQRWAATDDRPRAVVGAKTFTEQYILAALMADRLEAAGFAPRALDSLGSTVIFDALVAGEIDCYVDYTGTIWANHMRRSDTLPADEVLDEMTRWLQQTHGVVCLGPLGFENAYAFAMRRQQADQLGVATVEDLRRHSRQLRMGGDYEFFARPEWVAARDTYGLEFRERRTFDSTLMYAAVRDGHVDVISAFSTDGRIAAFDLVTLEDTHQAMPPYDAVILLSPQAARQPELVEALRGMLHAIDDQLMRTANMMVDVDRQPVDAAAGWLGDQIRQ